MSLTTTRMELAEALQNAGYSLYAFPSETMIAPCVVLVPGEPYVVWETPIRRSASFRITLCVVLNDNQAALMNLETLIDELSEILPTSMGIGDFSQPSPQEIGSTTFLTTDISLSVVIN